MAIALLALPGCAAPTTAREVEGVPGTMSGAPGRPGVVIGAPHGARTGEIAAELARRTGFGVVIANGVDIEPDTSESSSEEVATKAARRVAEAYERRVRAIAQGPLAFYAEIHGNSHQDAASRIAVATVGVDHDEAVRLRTLFELIRDAHLRGTPEAPRLEILVEPADLLRDATSGAKRDGIFRLPQRALHIELPRAARTEWRETYTAILADFLAQAASIPPRQ